MIELVVVMVVVVAAAAANSYDQGVVKARLI